MSEYSDFTTRNASISRWATRPRKRCMQMLREAVPASLTSTLKKRSPKRHRRLPSSNRKLHNQSTGYHLKLSFFCLLHGGQLHPASLTGYKKNPLFGLNGNNEFVNPDNEIYRLTILSPSNQLTSPEFSGYISFSIACNNTPTLFSASGRLSVAG
jgi:hypothetical protein